MRSRVTASPKVCGGRGLATLRSIGWRARSTSPIRPSPRLWPPTTKPAPLQPRRDPALCRRLRPWIRRATIASRTNGLFAAPDNPMNTPTTALVAKSPTNLISGVGFVISWPLAKRRLKRARPILSRRGSAYMRNSQTTICNLEASTRSPHSWSHGRCLSKSTQPDAGEAYRRRCVWTGCRSGRHSTVERQGAGFRHCSPAGALRTCDRQSCGAARVKFYARCRRGP